MLSYSCPFSGISRASAGIAVAGIGKGAQGLSDWLGSADAPDITPLPQDQRPVEVNASLSIGLAPELVLHSQNMAAISGNVRMSTGNIFAEASF
ncbi:MAG: hypothetical protein LBU76_01390 [Azoarcus sp.]|jgi:hypothetical protein|nr:hypothetical protein [Azoarcus sp.]